MEVPREWTDLLTRLSEVIGPVVLAGGALRDLDNGRQVKDLDFFVHAADQKAFVSMASRLREAGFSLKHSMPAGSYLQGWTEEVVGLIDLSEGVGPNELPAQIVVINAPLSTVRERMDFGLCRISYDGYAVYRSYSYKHDVDNHTITLLRPGSNAQVRRSLKRYERLRQKYDWPLIDRVSETAAE